MILFRVALHRLLRLQCFGHNRRTLASGRDCDSLRSRRSDLATIVVEALREETFSVAYCDTFTTIESLLAT